MAEKTAGSEPYIYVEQMPALGGKRGIAEITAAVQQRAFNPEEVGAAEVGCLDNPVAVEGKVAGRGEIVEIGEHFKSRLHLIPRLAS